MRQPCSWGAIVLGVSLPAAVCAAPGILPLRTVRLYETGVGYFERSGTVSGQGGTSLPVPAGHLDDALKTLVVIGPAEGKGQVRVRGLEFGSSMSKGMARTLAGLPVGADEPISYRDLLASLKGARVEVQADKGRFTGRILDVIETTEALEPTREVAETGKDPDKGGKAAAPAPRPELVVLLLGEHAEVRRFRASRIEAVRALDAGPAGRLSSALDALATHGAQTRRLLRLLASSDGPVTIGYVAEAPVWRTTYRLVVEPARAELQGWALLHNDADEDWRGVQVHLLNGRPDSFLFPLAAPRYERRELLHPESELSTVPQLLDTTVDAIWGDHAEGGFGLSGSGSGGGGTGEGTIGFGHVGTIGRGGGAGAAAVPSPSSVLTVGNLAGGGAAAGVEAGALFDYTLAAPLDLRAHGSALVPFVQQPIEAELLTWFSAPGGPGRSALRLRNSTRSTLPAGPIAVFAGGGFAGEALLERLKPGERRFLPFGTDLDVEVSARPGRARDEIKRLTLEDGNLVEHFLRHGETTYTIENRAGQPRRVYLQLAVGRNARVSGADGMDFDTAQNMALAIFQAPAQKRDERVVSTVEGLSQRHPAAELGAAHLGELAAAQGLPAAERAVAEEAAARYRDLAATRQQMDKARADAAKVEEDLKRWREDLRALGGDKAGAQHPFVRRVLEGEDRLSALRQRAAALEEESTRGRDAALAVLGRLQQK